MGPLVTLLSYMLKAVDTVTAHILVAAMVGFFLALGPFDHAAVSALHRQPGGRPPADHPDPHRPGQGLRLTASPLP